MTDATDTAEFLLRRAEQRQAHFTERAREVRDRLEVAAATVRRRFGATRVVLFGSLARNALHERSDVDIAVEGIERSDEAMVADLLGRAAELPIDLVRIEDAPMSLKARIERDGVDLVSDE